ncbi:MAG: N-6 DNA methylase [Piscirickettsiaceae bacterium]|nr:N-6 DNA methylase [Piscirickettsiaceae bacterium]
MKFKVDQSSQKLRGGYYTPQNLADYTAKWALKHNPKSILEPSCGDGVFIQSIINNQYDTTCNVSGFELFDTEARKSRALCKSIGLLNAEIIEGDFLDWANKQLIDKKEKFDAVLGNPPFIRYQFLEKEFQINTEQVFKTLGLKFTKHTNAWVPFILSSIALLKPGGRLGMVIPSEIIHVLHAQSLRTFLGLHCRKIVLIDPQELWFEGTLQGAVIIFAEKKAHFEDETEGVGIRHVKGFDFLNTDPNQIFDETKAINGETVVGKWTKALLEDSQLKLIERICSKKTVHYFSDIATVDVGMVTGANKFFLVNNETVEKHKLEDYVTPMFGRSEHCKGVIYDEKQHTTNQELGHPTNFVYLEDELDNYSIEIQKYILSGQEDELHTRYKCRIRKPWYKVPSVYATKIGMLKRSHDGPRLIFNELNALTTDTAYRITSSVVEAEKLVYCFINPLTAIFAELQGRYYGGGVLELVPSEIEKLIIPIPNNIDVDLNELDELIRTRPMEEVLLINGYKVLGAIGVSKEDTRSLLQIWLYLKNRRQRKDH